MKILLINSVCGEGSTGKICVDIYNLVKEGGHDCKVIYGRGRPLENKDFVKIGDMIDFYFNTLQSRLFDNHGRGTKRNTKKIIKFISDYDPDIIHLHNIHGYYINYEVFFKFLKESRKKIIWTLHDCWPFTGHCSYFNAISCEKWKIECNNCPQINEYPKSIFLDKSKKNFHIKSKAFTCLDDLTIVTPSEWLQTLVKKSFLSKYNSVVIKNGIDISKFSEKGSCYKLPEPYKHKKILLGIAQIWNKRKGFDYFLKLSKIIDDDYVIVLVGLSTVQLGKIKLPYNVLGIERTSNMEELAELYRSAYFFINFSLDDNYPTVCLEAQACGTNVLTFDVGGCKETLYSNLSKSFKIGDLESIWKYIKHTKNVNYICNISTLNKKETFKEYLELYENE